MDTTSQTGRSVIIIGAGIAGLSAGVYARLNGYAARIYEMHTLPGGLMTAWKRKGYVIDGCIHWLSGSAAVMPDYYQMWQDIGLMQNREMVNPEIFSRVEGPNGQVLLLYTDVNKLEKHLLELAPEDREVIHDLCQSIRAFCPFLTMPAGSQGFSSVFKMIGKLPSLVPGMLRMPRWSKMTMGEFAERFKNPFLRETFKTMWYPEMMAMGLLFTLGMLNLKSAGYPMGGSLPMALAVEKRFSDLGGQICYGERVTEILVENNQAVGVRLADGTEERADIVISAADGRTTLFDMLSGKYVDEGFQTMYREMPRFPSILLIGMGVDRTFDDLPAMTGGCSIPLETPIEVAGEPVKRLDVMIYNFDPSLAPQGKTAVTCMMNTSYSYWKELSKEPERYQAEKERVALAVIAQLGQRFPGLDAQVEMADVATPVTFERFTGNWEGNFEGWLPTPKTMGKPARYTLPGLENFYMVGQWVQVGGGLPSGVMTGRAVVQQMCKKDGKTFHH